MENSLKFAQPNGFQSSVEFSNNRFTIKSPVRTYEASIPNSGVVKLKGDANLYEILINQNTRIQAPDTLYQFDKFQIVLTQDSIGSHQIEFSNDFLFKDGIHLLSLQENLSSIISCTVTKNLKILAEINTGFNEIINLPV